MARGSLLGPVRWGQAHCHCTGLSHTSATSNPCILDSNPGLTSRAQAGPHGACQQEMGEGLLFGPPEYQSVFSYALSPFLGAQGGLDGTSENAAGWTPVE